MTLTRPPHLPELLIPIWEELMPQFRPKIGAVGLEAVCVQVLRLRDAQDRIGREGLVVADPKGAPGPHPALAIESAASREISRWLEKFGVR